MTATARERAFTQVDVFTQIPLRGNPVAVVLDGAGIDDAAMQAFANWTNLSETTFVLPATDAAADYALRIFTPKSELPFAGHPTLGTAHAVLAAGLAQPRHGKLVQQCAIGLVEIDVGDGGLSFTLPTAMLTPAPAPDMLAAALGAALLAPPMVVDVGPRWVVGEVSGWDALGALRPDIAALAAYDRAHGVSGQTLFARDADPAGPLLVRSFAAGDGIAEDPVCGSGNGAVAAFRLAQGSLVDGDRYTAVQGRSVGRDGRVEVRIVDGAVHVGGACCTVISGMVLL